MRQKATQIRRFHYQEEQGQNPYIGFLSYQHFRDGELYSDVIVRPEKGMTETENYECYPVPENVAQNGRDEGFYPDSTVAYIRILWKEFEPRQGEYHCEVIEEILQRAKENGQTVMFRLMPHSTRARDDVPDWLKEIMPCPDRPDGARVKDSPTDPAYLELFGKAIEKIAERFDDDPTLDVVDICLPGAWGEGHNLHLYSEEVLKQHVDVYTRCFRNTHLLGQVAAPGLIRYANETRPVGWRGDGTGHGEHMQEIFPKAEAQIPEVWKKSPVSFESFYWLGEWYRKGWNLDEIIELTLKWHISTFNGKNFPIPYEWQDKIRYWNSKMGYHFAIDYFKTPQAALAGDELEIEWCMDNCGVAPIYRQIPVVIRLINEETSYTFDAGVDIRNWLPGKNVNQRFIKLPENMKSGNYKVEIGIMDETVPMIYFATDAASDGAYYIVGELMVSEEEPLDSIAPNGGLTRIFRTIGCIGDSLSSGEFQVKNQDGKWEFYDMYEYSWGQHIARLTGSTVYNFSRGGMTAKTYWESFADQSRFWSPEKACQAYIIALGVNDLRRIEVGSVEDIDFDDYRNNKETFAGYYGAIVQRLKEIQPRAKFFFVTIPQNDNAKEREYRDAHRDLLEKLAEKFDNAYLVDLRTYAPVYSDSFHKMYCLNGHMNPAGYVYSGDMIASYIDYIIRHQIEDFDQIGFIGTNITDHGDWRK